MEMIAISDNTATDHLIHHVGRRKVEAWMARHHGQPELNVPFLTAREFFGLKYGNDQELLQRYVLATETDRRTILQKAALAEPIGFPSETPVAIDTVEWFASTDETCLLLFALREMDGVAESTELMSVLTTRRRGIRLGPDHWKVVAYKGGRETGVLNLSWLLQRYDGRWYAVSATFNDSSEDIAEEQTSGLAVAAIRLLASID